MILACQNISKAFGTTEIIKNASFHIEEREKTALVGINGAGKSTTMNIITGYLASTEGEVLINGHNILEEPEEAKKCICLLYTSPSPRD